MTGATSPIVRLLKSEDRVVIMDKFIRRFESELTVTTRLMSIQNL